MTEPVIEPVSNLVPVTASDLAALVSRPAEPTTGPKPETATADTAALDQLRRRAGEPDELRTAIAARLNVARDADLLSALDEVITRASRPQVPEGCEVLDSDALAELRRDAEVGRTARETALVSAAVADGRIPPASRSSWLTLLATDPNAERTLASLRKGTIPVSPVGYSNENEERDALYDSVFRD